MVWVKLPWVSGTPECIFMEAEGSETYAEKGQPPVQLVNTVLRHTHRWPGLASCPVERRRQLMR